MEVFKPNYCQCSDNLKVSRVTDFKCRFAIFLFSPSHKSTNRANFGIFIVLTARKVFKKTLKIFKFLEHYTKYGLLKESSIQGLFLYSDVLLLINVCVLDFLSIYRSSEAFSTAEYLLVQLASIYLKVLSIVTCF